MIAIGCAILVAIQDQLHLQGNQIEEEVPHCSELEGKFDWSNDSEINVRIFRKHYFKQAVAANIPIGLSSFNVI